MPLGNSHFDASELLTEFNSVDSMHHYPTLPPDAVSSGGDVDLNGNDVEIDLHDMPKLLVVEDNVEVRSYIKSIFIGSYIIYEAGEGKEGFDIALEEMPDLIISDVMMPVMDGITFCKEIKGNIKTSHIPVILLTARTSLIFKVEGLETGADDYITKPFSPKVLELKVKNIMRTRFLMRKVFDDIEILNIEPKRVSLTSADEIFIGKALESIERNMSNADYSIEDLNVDVGMSRMQLYRKLKGLTGQSANEFIRTIRLKRAAQLLEQNQLTIAEVTYEVGFNDLQYFRECFKKLFLVTPSEYVQSKTRSQQKKNTDD
jgi:YesN/AraC family two-component response regulator